MSGSPVIERLSGTHAVDLAQLHARCFARGWSVAEFEQLACDPACAGHVARDSGGIRGGLVARLLRAIFTGGARRGERIAGAIIARGAADEAEILTIMVAPQARRRGIGAALLHTHLSALAAKGMTRIFLEVAADNKAALGLYKTMGFVQTGERKAYYTGADGGKINALILCRHGDDRDQRPPRAGR